MGYRVGIDLGTTFSAVAYINPSTGTPEVVKNKYGESVTPSVLAFNEDGTVLFGQDAKEEKSLGNPNTASFFKRDMGNMRAEVEYWGKIYNPKDLSSILLKKLVSQAEEKLQGKVDEVVITVPAYFTNIERSATLQAGEEAGLKVAGIINEPSAAAFAYGLNNAAEKTVLIYDLGGGTFDVSIAHISDDSIDIIGTAGDHQLGGKDWDASIVSWIEDQFEEQFGCEIEFDFETDARIMELAEKAKKELSVRQNTIIRFSQNGKKGQYELSVEELNDITSYQLGITKKIIDNLFLEVSEKQKKNFGWNNIDEVILVGGSTRMKMVEEYIVENLHRQPLHGINVDEAVALGAAIYANIDKEGNVLPNVVDTLGSRNRNRDTIAGGKKIRDTIAHSMGMIAENEKGDAYVNSVIIRKNSSIPVESTKVHRLYTSSTQKNELEVYLLQGDAKDPLACLIIGKYVFYDIRHESGGVKIEVTYRYNQNGIIDVEAAQAGRRLSVRVEEVPKDMSWLKELPKRSTKAVDIDIYLMIDLSYSMVSSVGHVQTVIKDFLEELDFDKTRIAMIGVADRVSVMQKLTKNKREFLRALQRLDDAVENGYVGYGNDTQPFEQLYQMVRKENEKNRKSIGIVLADGMWNKEAVEESYKYSKICHDKGIEIIALGFGSANESFLKQIASMKDLSSLRDLNQLSEEFSKIARVVSNGLTAD